MPDERKLIIIGSGAAGYTAAIYAGRAMLAPLLFSGQEPGGQLAATTDVENFPGWPQGIQGPELMQKFREQAARFETEIIDGAITRIDFSQRPLRVWFGEKEYQAKAVIMATGAVARWLGIESETRLRGHGVSSCATCDGFFFKGKEVVVAGSGDSAMEESTYLTKFCTKVTVVARSDRLRASKIMQEKAKANPKIFFIFNNDVAEILGKEKVEGARLKNNKDGSEQTIVCQGIFVAIGHQPNTAIFKDQIELDAKGYVVTKEHTMTNVEGVFAAGDVADYRYRQAITAAGSGCQAAIDAERWLGENN